MLRSSLFALLLAAPVPASACLPPPPGQVEARLPTLAERANGIEAWATDIVGGTLISNSGDHGRARFRVRHVYKGALRPGQIIKVEASNRFVNLPCPAMMPTMPLSRGESGVIAFDRAPEVNWVDDAVLEQLVASGAIRAARERR